MMDSKSIVGDNVPVRVRPPVLIQNISSVSENKNRLEYASLFLFVANEICIIRIQKRLMMQLANNQQIS